MAISIKKSSAPKTMEPVSSLSPEVQTQIGNNLKLDNTDYTALPDPEPVQAASSVTETKPVAEEKGKRTDDVVQLKFSKGKRSEAKAFFASCDLKMNAGFEMAYEYIKEEVLAGNIKLSKSGIQRLKRVGE